MGATGEPPAAPYTPADFRLRLDRDPAVATPGPSPWPFAGRPLLDSVAVPHVTTPPAASTATPRAALAGSATGTGRSSAPPLSPLQWEQVVARTSALDTSELTGLVERAVAPLPVETPAGPPPVDALALVPDAPEVPAVVPHIVPAEPDRVPEPAAAVTAVIPSLPTSAPVLPTLGAAPTPVVPGAPARPQRPAAMPVVAPPAPAPGAPPRRSLLPRLLSLLLVVTLLGGGALAVTRYLLAVPAWDADVRPMADEVATIRGLAFRSPVAVEELPIGRYVIALTDTVLPADQATRSLMLAEWRAFGLLDDTVGLATAGRRATVDMPAFYDHERRVVVVADGLGETLRSFATERALAWALLDQHQNWADSLRLAGPSDAFAIRSAIDAEAIAIARAAVGTPAEHQRLLAESDAWAATVLGAEEVGPSWLSATIGRPGAPAASRVEALSNEQRSASPTLRSTSATRGAMFWYHVLAVHLDPVQAWRVATGWANDTTTTVADGADGTACTTALVTSVDAAGAAAMLAAFQSWAAAMPSVRDASAVSAGELDVRVRACDPGRRAPAGAGDGVVPFGGASVEVHAITVGEAEVGPLTEPARACIATRVRAAVSSLATADLAPVVPPLGPWSPPALATFDVAVAASECQSG